MVDPKDLPLRDIHLPAPVPWWPPAPGWWILGGALLALATTAGAIWWWRRRTRLRRHARQRFVAISQAYAIHRDRHRLACELSMLCRQVALQLCAETDAAAVTGAAWLSRLDTFSPQRFFSEGPGRVLADAPYNPAASTFDAAALLAGYANWLRRLPPARRPHV